MKRERWQVSTWRSTAKPGTSKVFDPGANQPMPKGGRVKLAGKRASRPAILAGLLLALFYPGTFQSARSGLASGLTTEGANSLGRTFTEADFADHVKQLK